MLDGHSQMHDVVFSRFFATDSEIHGHTVLLGTMDDLDAIDRVHPVRYQAAVYELTEFGFRNVVFCMGCVPYVAVMVDEVPSHA